MPSIQSIHEELAGRDDVAIFALNSGADTRDVVAGFWQEQGFGFEAVLDAGERGANARALGVKVYPTNIVVGPDGRVQYASVGFSEAKIRALLGLPAQG